MTVHGPSRPTRTTGQTCTIVGCDDPIWARGWCTKHLQRWDRTGNPIRTLEPHERATRRDSTANHGTRHRYHHGCRCLPCAVAESRYQTSWRNGRRRRVPADVVIAHLDRLNAAGWTDADLTRELDLGNSTLWSIRNVNATVNSRNADKILNLDVPTDLTGLKLPAGPLLSALDTAADRHRATDPRAVAGLRSLLGDAHYRAVLRAKNDGHITATLADRIATQALGTPLELIYGPDWDTTGAAA